MPGQSTVQHQQVTRLSSATAAPVAIIFRFLHYREPQWQSESKRSFATVTLLGCHERDNDDTVIQSSSLLFRSFFFFFATEDRVQSREGS
uniref:Uncharacterized protein n=1 Tax=Anopheles coluzzii TaxID=1518534 RepID=A0A6E8WBT9_ANOCL